MMRDAGTSHDDTPNMQRAQAQAAALAREQLRAADLVRAARLGGLQVMPDGKVEIQLLGRTLYIEKETLSIRADDDEPVHVVEELLVLRYLAAGREIRPVGESVSFRQFPGGLFYLQPILNRTSRIVLETFGNDIGRLRVAHSRVPHALLALGDLSAQVRAIGRIDVTLVYRLGDEEFPATFDVLFDRVVMAVYRIDEAAALAQRICLALERR